MTCIRGIRAVTVSQDGSSKFEVRRSNSLSFRTLIFVFLFPVSSLRAVASVDVSPLKDRVQSLHERVIELAGEGDLLDTLYFAWSDRPYARATLAILIKVTATLEREVDCRYHGNGKIDDATVESMLQWADGAIQRVIHAEPTDDFRPHRMKVTWPDLLDGGKVPPLFTFVDGTQLAPRDPALGDLDILAALGQRIYACGDPWWSTVAKFETRARRAEALGIMVVDAVPAGMAGRCESCLLGNSPRWPELLQCVAWMDFTNLLNGGDLLESSEFTELPAVLDDPNSESLSASLARRAMARGVTGRSTYAAYGWTPPMPEDVSNRGAVVSAAMWVETLDGQRLTLLESWRDVHAKYWPPRPSIFTDPSGVETIAHTALDLLRLAEFIRPFEARSYAVIKVSRDAMASGADGGDANRVSNRWAPWVRPIWEALVARQVSFDVVPDRTEEMALRKRYRVVFPLRREECIDPAVAIGKLERRLAQIEEHVYRLTAREMNGTIAADVYVRAGKTPGGKACAAVVNLTARQRALKLRGKPAIGPSRDVISNQQISEPDQRLEFAPWQVRLLWPVE